MPTDTSLELTSTKCFKDDTARIKRLGEVLEARERTGFSSQHTLSRALDALERELAKAEAA
jgi:hypothetical protein